MQFRFFIPPVPVPLPDCSSEGAAGELSTDRFSRHTACPGCPQGTGKGRGTGTGRTPERQSQQARKLSASLFLGMMLSLMAVGPVLPMNEEDCSRLVTDLGDSSWDRREIAERELLARGLPVAKLLEEATRSRNLELAYRAKYLLSRIDPNIIEYQILRLEIPGREIPGGKVEVPLRVVAMATLWAADGMKGEARFVRLDNDTPVKSSLPTFLMTGRTLSDGRIEIEIGQARAGAPGGSAMVDLGVIVTAPGTATLLTTSEESDYRRLGLHVEREYTRIVTVLHVRRGRQSFVERTPLPTNGDALLAQLRGQLRKEVGATDLERRKEALELLTRLRVKLPAKLLRPQLAEPATQALASLCTDDVDLLAEVVTNAAALFESSAASADVTTSTVARRTNAATRLRAAIRLLELGDERGFEVLLRTLHEGNRLLIHPVMVVLADSARAGALSPSARRRFLEAVFSEAFLARAAWNDVETVYLLSTAIALLKPENRRDVALADGLLSRLKRLLRGELGQASLRFRTAIDLWRQLNRRLPGGERSEVTFILQVLPAMRSSMNLSAAFGLLKDALENGEGSGSGSRLTRPPGELDNEELTLLLLVILDGIHGRDESVYRKSHEALRSVSHQLTLRPGQLRALVGTLVKAADLSRGRPTYGRDLKFLRAELQRWTRLAPHTGNQTTFDATTWTEWLDDDALVAAREKELLALTGRKEVRKEASPETASAGRHLVYYEFDLALGKNSPGEFRAGDQENRFQLLDGRRLRVSPSESLFYEDRWGNPLVLRLTGNADAERDGPVRFRVSHLNKYLFTGRLELTHVGGKEFSLTRYETSDGLLGSRPLHGNRGKYRSLVLLQFLDEEASSPPRGEDVESLWQWFLENHLLHLPSNPTRGHIKDRLGILKTLEVGEWCRPFLRNLLTMRELLGTRQAVEIAKDLHRLGDEVGLRFLRGKVSSESLEERLAAARGLCELGLRVGVEALVEHFDSETESNKVLKALNNYLQHEGADAEGRAQILDFLASKLTHSGFQNRAFKLIQQEAGIDFGYKAARGRKDPKEREREIESAVRKARAWWRKQKASSK